MNLFHKAFMVSREDRHVTGEALLAQAASAVVTALHLLDI